MNTNIKENITRCEKIEKELDRVWPDYKFFISIGVDERLYKNCVINIIWYEGPQEKEVESALSKFNGDLRLSKKSIRRIPRCRFKK